MARRATEAEEKSLVTEQSLSPEAMGESFPVITVRIVYLQTNPFKTERVKGQMIMETVGQRLEKDELPPEGGWTGDNIIHLNKRKSAEGYTVYDFSAVDSKGRKRKDGWTPDGKRFVLCEHLDHMLYFYRLRDDRDNTPIYEVRELADQPGSLDVLVRYRDRRKGRVGISVVQTDRGVAEQGPGLLAEMTDALDK
jgi:hypothetical protein